MNRNMVYPGAIPLDTDVLTVQRSIMSALGFLAQATLGTNTVVDGLACTPTQPASPAVQLAPGSILSMQTVDGSAFGSLPADNADPLVKMGINTSSVLSSTLTGGTFTPPGTTGQSTAYLIQAAFQESDGTAVVLPYYNSSNPAVPYSGPNNAGTPNNTQRLQTVNLQIKAGTPATTGSQVTPTPDSGFVGLYSITVAFGQTTITNSNITTLATAPFIQFKLPTLRPGFQTMTPLTSSGPFVVPAGVFFMDVEVWGAGGGSGGTQGSATASQGGGGGYSRDIVSVTPGQVITVTIGAPGTAGLNTTPSPGGTGGTSSFGTLLSATGGAGGLASSSGLASGVASGGVGAGPTGAFNVSGGTSGGSFTVGSTTAVSQGGASFGTPQTHLGCTGAAATGVTGLTPGGGAGGALNGNSGAAGGAGLVIVRY